MASTSSRSSSSSSSSYHSAIDSKYIVGSYPIHWAVWNNDLDALKSALKKFSAQIDTPDPRGKTPLLLAVCLDHFECAKYLLEKGARCDVRHRGGWSAVHEATCTGDVELLSLVLQYRDAEKLRLMRNLDSQLLGKLRDVPDFYVEMKWEFSSWIPFVAKFCPSDVCRIYKKGANVRLDTTLIGFEGMTWQRGRQSFLFLEDADTHKMQFHEVDHDTRIIRTEKNSQFHSLADDTLSVDAEMFTIPSDEVLQQRMRTPVMLTTLDSEGIQFERVLAGLFWKSAKEEEISGHICQVSSASNLAFVTRLRSEHMTENDKERMRKEMTSHPLNSLFMRNNKLNNSSKNEAGMTEPETTTTTTTTTYNNETILSSLSAEEYFDKDFEVGERDVGRPKKLAQRSKVFKANLWMCEDYPLSLSQQILPIVDMMASTNAHFAKLRDFISLHLPSGFPLKIEIPLFHVLTAKITFENINGSVSEVENVTSHAASDRGDDSSPVTRCDIADQVFHLPDGYERQDASWRDDLAAMLDPEQDSDAVSIPDEVLPKH